jgi:hypothetical protein
MTNDKTITEKTKVVHCKISKYDIYIGRGSIFGNRWSHKEGTLAEFKVDTREEAIRLHKEWLLTQPDMLMKVRDMKGKVLGCWCKHPANPLDCHGDTFAEIAEMDDATFSKLLVCARKNQQVNSSPPNLPPGRIPFDPNE